MAVSLNNLKRFKGSTHYRKRVGRGVGSGHGKTSCRGHKGQKARTGGSIPPGFEGGRMPLIRRIPKRGFTNKFRESCEIINLSTLDKLKESEITSQLLMEKGLISNPTVKVLGNGDIKRAVNLKVNAISKSAKEKIEKSGGSVTIL